MWVKYTNCIKPTHYTFVNCSCKRDIVKKINNETIVWVSKILKFTPTHFETVSLYSKREI